MPLDDPDNPLAIEIYQEAGTAYFAACRKMLAALEALRAFDLVAGLARQEQAGPERRSELISEAAERVYFVLIQREALRLSCSETFFEDYGVPDEVKARLGPRRR